MSDTAYLLFNAAIVLQLPIAVLVYLDARRLELAHPIIYCFGILIPAGGFIVIPVYLSRRHEFPKATDR